MKTATLMGWIREHIGVELVEEIRDFGGGLLLRLVDGRVGYLYLDAKGIPVAAIPAA